MSKRVMKTSDIHGWGVDPDLAQVHPDWSVRMEMINVYEPDVPADELDDGRIEAMRALYAQYGPWALPPVVCIGDGDWQIAGLHRMWAAHRAGITHVPSFIVQPID